ncbi:MAG: very short patch repair endonuclease [Roseiarcus sp.]
MRSVRYKRPTDPSRSELMRRVRQHGTKPEQDAAALLRELGLRYRRNVRTLPGSPDFANKSRRWALFVHGCFWHRHRNCERATIPTRNQRFWLDKFSANEKRDRRNARKLRSIGFRVITVWECQAEDTPRLLRRLARNLGVG